MTVLSWCQKMEEMLVKTRLKYETCLVWGTITTTPSFSSGNRMELFVRFTSTSRLPISRAQHKMITFFEGFKQIWESVSQLPHFLCKVSLLTQSPATQNGLHVSKLQQSHWNILSHALWTSKANTSRPQWTPSRVTLCGYTCGWRCILVIYINTTGAHFKTPNNTERNGNKWLCLLV